MNTELYAIRCRFQIEENSPVIQGMAICSSPDEPVTFIHPDGKPYVGIDIWDYNLIHYSPWAKIEVGPNV